MGKEQEKKKEKIRSNNLIENIVKTYPASISCYPRETFERQLTRHLLSMGVK